VYHSVPSVPLCAQTEPFTFQTRVTARAYLETIEFHMPSLRVCSLYTNSLNTEIDSPFIDQTRTISTLVKLGNTR